MKTYDFVQFVYMHRVHTILRLCGYIQAFIVAGYVSLIIIILLQVVYIYTAQGSINDSRRSRACTIKAIANL